jgi:microcystin-dependent protein
MATPYLSEIRIFSFPFAPKGWALCNGQLLAIAQNQALFSLLGTAYGGNGQTNFALPNLQGRTPMHVGSGMVQGQTAGEINHTLTLSELPAHNHFVQASSDTPTVSTPVNNFFASNTSYTPYGTTPNTTMAPTNTSSIGGNQPHNNMCPYLVLNFCIALQGIFPSRN